MSISPPLFLKAFIYSLLFLKLAASRVDEFTLNGFNGANLSLDGIASITSDGLLRLTNEKKEIKGHAFHPDPLHFRTSPNGTVYSFSTNFIFGIHPQYTDLGADGMAFVISPTKDLTNALTNQYLGLFNAKNNGNSANHVFAVELDTILNSEFQDINDNHVGIDINSLKSNASIPAGYYADDTGLFNNLTLISGQPMQVWVDYDGQGMRLNVTMSPMGTSKPKRPLLSSPIDLSSVMLDTMYVGFSSSTGPVVTSNYVLGWSFKMNGIAQALDLSELPSLPRVRSRRDSHVLSTWLPVASVAFVLIAVAGITYIVRRRMKFAELLEDWELEYGPHRFSYKDLFRATKGFEDKDVLGIGGFGRVYKGVLPASKMEVAVKRVSHESWQGMKEFIAEIVSIGQLRHRNIVQLLGYCRRKGELLLVYDFMPNGSLDKYLYDHEKPTLLDWAQRFRIIKGVASGLLYLHEEWEQVVIHRDIKASNVLLDGGMNGRLGDFGLARLYDHGSHPQTTHVVGTMGYLAPELARTGKASTATDVFAFGAFVLEVACGRKPVEPNATGEHVVLVDWVVERWKRGRILDTIDPRLGSESAVEEMEIEMVLKLGLLCSHPLPLNRPSMSQVMQFFDGVAPLPELSPTYLSYSMLAMPQKDGFDEYILSYPSVATASSLSGRSMIFSG